MYESLSLTQNSIVCAEVTGFVEQKLRFSEVYLFVVEILWTDKSTTYVKRSYSDFFQFYLDIKRHFDDKWLKGILKSPIYIPQINGKCIIVRVRGHRIIYMDEILRWYLMSQPSIQNK